MRCENLSGATLAVSKRRFRCVKQVNGMSTVDVPVVSKTAKYTRKNGYELFLDEDKFEKLKSLLEACRPRLSLAKVLIFSLMISQALFMSSSTSKFSKAANLFIISIWYFSLTSSSFSFLRLNPSPSNFCAAFLFAYPYSEQRAVCHTGHNI